MARVTMLWRTCDDIEDGQTNNNGCTGEGLTLEVRLV